MCDFGQFNFFRSYIKIITNPLREKGGNIVGEGYRVRALVYLFPSYWLKSVSSEAEKKVLLNF